MKDVFLKCRQNIFLFNSLREVKFFICSSDPRFWGDPVKEIHGGPRCQQHSKNNNISTSIYLSIYREIERERERERENNRQSTSVFFVHRLTKYLCSSLYWALLHDNTCYKIKLQMLTQLAVNREIKYISWQTQSGYLQYPSTILNITLSCIFLYWVYDCNHCI